MENTHDTSAPIWQRHIWGWVTAGLGLTCFLLIMLVAYSIYRTTGIVDSRKNADLAFVFSGIALVNSTLLRLLAMLIGSGVIFGGLAVSFFTHSQSSRFGIDAKEGASSVRTMIASHSPGIIGIFIGGVIIIAALYARSTQTYSAPRYVAVTPSSHFAGNIPTNEDQSLPDLNSLLKGSNEKSQENGK